ncbi:MAG: hypothetical protein ACYC0J_08750, partial [Gammaproteobacteria bacterium]
GMTVVARNDGSSVILILFMFIFGFCSLEESKVYFIKTWPSSKMMFGVEQLNPLSLLDMLKLGVPAPRWSSASSLLNQIIEEMHHYEQAKYPNPPNEYKRVEISANGKKINAIYTKYNGTPLTDAQFIEAEVSAIKLRQLSLLAGVTNALLFSNQYLQVDAVKRANLFSLIHHFMKKIKAKKSFIEDDVNIFVDELVRCIQIETHQDYKVVLRQVRLAERYFVADYQPTIFVNETTEHGEVTTQLNISLKNPLTQAQKKELVKIHTDNKPAWFERLSLWERDWLIQRVPSLLSNQIQWEAFESLYQSSAMSHIPGVQNIRRSFIVKGERVISDSIKSGTYVPYKMPEIDRESQTNENADQVLDVMAVLAHENFNRAWPGISIKPLLYFQSILSDTVGGGQDNQLANIQKNAVSNKSYLHADFIVVTGNDPVNFLRLFAAESGFFSKEVSGRWDHNIRILQYANKFVSLASKCNLDQEQERKLKLIKMLKAELELMHRKTQFTGLARNFNAYKVAYTELLVEAMGGMVSTNCKSGKDRTGFDDLYRQAILIYTERYGMLPRYDDQGDNRQQFINIFVPLFNSNKLQELAAGNTPGSFGLKDSARMLCRDIVGVLGKSYQQSNQLADMNKPMILKRDELKESDELNAIAYRKSKAVMVKEDVASGKESNLLTKVDRIKKICVNWRATERYHGTKNQLSSVVFSKQIRPNIKVGFEVLQNEITTKDTDPIVYEAMIRTFFAIHPLNKKTLLTAANREVAEKIYEICESLGALAFRVNLLSGEKYIKPPSLKL